MTPVYSWSADDIRAAVGGEVILPGREDGFSSVSIDSRTLLQGALFIAIRGENHDGHRFVGSAAEKGAKGLIAASDHLEQLNLDELKSKSIACIAVENTTEALGRLARHHRRQSNVSIAAITGSNGKTTTRAMTSSVMAQSYEVLSTRGNYNNEFGLPLTLLRLGNAHQWGVVELGMNHPGEIRCLGRICEPEIGVITNIGPAHLEGLDTVDGVMAAKGELLETISSEGLAILNADDPRCRLLAEKAETEVILYGLSPDAHIRGKDIDEAPEGIGLTLKTPDGEIRINLRVQGRFMVSNALAAAAAAWSAGVSLTDIRSGLAVFQPVPGRMAVLDTPAGIRLIDDSYNANPASMKAALDVLRSLKKGRRGIFICGDMLELGTHTGQFHREIGEYAAKTGVDRIYAAGPNAVKVAEGALTAGMPENAVFCGGKPEILELLQSSLRRGDLVLVKGSRGMAMEDVSKGVHELKDSSLAC